MLDLFADMPFNIFDELYDRTLDSQKMVKILEEIKGYDVYDFLSRVAALKLIQENQSKSILLDSLIASVLTLKKVDTSSKIIMSSGKFRKIISKLETFDLSSAEDPPENMFIERILFYENYYIFPGINYLPGYIIQSFISTLFRYKNDYDKDLIEEIAKLFYTVLNISNDIAKELNLDSQQQQAIELSSKIIIPDKKTLDFLKNLLIINKSYLELLLGENEYLTKNIYSDFEMNNINDALNGQNQEFFNSPFLIKSDKEVILLDVTILASFAVHHALLLSKRKNQLETILNDINTYIWKDCIKSMKQLGHNKILESQMDIELTQTNNYKEVLLNIGNDQVFIFQGIFDDGTNYSKDELFGVYQNESLSDFFGTRMEYLILKLKKYGIPEENIFQCIVIGSLGRRMSVSTKKLLRYSLLCLNPFELKCISINERNQNLFLPRYIFSKSKLATPMRQSLISELNSIQIYTKNDNSFYIDDNFNPRKGVMYIAPGDSINYILKALKTENRHLVDSYKGGSKVEVIRNGADGIIYIYEDRRNFKASLFIEFKNVGVWIVSSKFKNYEELNLCFSTVDAISYWLSECEDIFNGYESAFATINIEVIFSDNIKDYYIDKKITKALVDTIHIIREENCIKVFLTAETFQLLNCKDNRYERELIECILEAIDENIMNIPGYWNQLDKIFNQAFKKKFFTLNYQEYPYLKPIVDGPMRKIRAADENDLLDEIGENLLESQKWSYGIIPTQERDQVAKYVVGYLYKVLQDTIKKLNPFNLVELIYLDLEKTIYNLLLGQRRFAYDVACYPDTKDKILNNFNELNKVSVSLKFLMEYVSAVPPQGEEYIGEWTYERLLAICSLIIDWAYKNDLFYYNIYNTPVEILPSGRIGMKHSEFDSTFNVLMNARELQMSYDALDNFIKCGTQTNETHLMDDVNEIDMAFYDEYGVSFKNFYNIVWTIIEIGDLQESEVKTYGKVSLIEEIHHREKDIDYDEVTNTIEMLSLKKRKDFLKPYGSYRVEDVYPWRFNRELSFTRRPIIQRDDMLIWGNRSLFHMLVFVIDLIAEGKLKVRKKMMKKVIGAISNRRGENFNNKIYQIIDSYNTFIVDKNLKKINNKYISDDNGKDLGDIDIILIYPLKKKIILVETKDFNISKNPYEIYCEYNEMFVDSSSKKSYATKHRSRVEWVQNHIDDVKVHFNLEDCKWTVLGIFIVNEHLLSNNVYNLRERIISLPELNLNILKNI